MDNGASSGLRGAALFLGLTSLAESVPSGPENPNDFQEEEIAFAEEITARSGRGRREDSVGVCLAASGTAKVGRSNLGRNSSSTEDTTTSGMITIPENGRGSSALHGRQSAPLNIPRWSQTRDSGSVTVDEYGEEEDDGRSAPHELIARMNSNIMRFSVFEGFGRTLKGRDLSRVRNAVLRQTGFLD